MTGSRTRVASLSGSCADDDRPAPRGRTGSPYVTVKLVELVAVPPEVLTVIAPLVDRFGTVATICVDDETVNFAVRPLNLTAETPVKFVPVIVTFVPTGPLAGVKPVTVGPAVTTVKLALLVAVPPGVVTEIVPVVAVDGTVAVICVPVLTVKAALTPWNLTAVAPPKFVPLIVTDVPAPPLVGVKLEIVGAGTTVNDEALVAVPPPVVTEIGPVVAPDGIVATI